MAAPELDYALNRLANGGNYAQLIVEAIQLPEALALNRPTLLKNLLWHAVVASDASLLQLTALPNSPSELALALVGMQNVPMGPGAYWESNRVVYANTNIENKVALNLQNESLFVGDTPQLLAAGSLSAAKDIDFSALSLPNNTTIDLVANPQLVYVIADEQDNRIIGSNYGNTLDAGAGNDSLKLGAGQDVLIFADSASNNGNDLIQGFELGTDLLNLNRFLNKTQGLVSLVPVQADQAIQKAWQSGDILVVNGYGLNTAADVAALFGAGKALAAPKGISKVVVMTASVVGDAKLWFVVNQTDLTRISPDEVAQVASLQGINNLLEQNTIASLRASLTLSATPGVFYYSQEGVSESLKNDGSISETLRINLTGDSFVGSMGAAIGSVTNLPAGLVAKLVKTADNEATLSLTGKASAHGLVNSINNLVIEFSDEDFASGSAAMNALKEDLAINFVDINMNESGGNLVISGGLSAPLSIDLSGYKVLSGGQLVQPLTGSLGNVGKVDLSAITSATSISVVGNSNPEIMIGSPTGQSLQGKMGNDYLVLGAGVDKIIFESTAALNGIDLIGGIDETRFKVGAAGDQLDFRAFLNKVSTSSLTPQNALAPTTQNWINGAILTLQGDKIDSATEIADLFGAGRAFAAPSGQAKAVVISADLIGNATVWYVTNQSTVGINSIEASEVEQVATLIGVNNLLLVPFVAANFVV